MRQEHFLETNSWDQVRHLVVSADEADAFLADEAYASDIAGFGTYSLSHIKKGLSPEGVSIYPVTSFPPDRQEAIYAAVTPDIFSQVYPDRRYNISEHLSDEVESNRGYGSSWALREVAREELGDDVFLRTSAMSAYFNTIRSFADYHDMSLLEYMAQVANMDVHKEEYADVYYVLRTVFKTDDDLRNFLTLLPGRGGVQVLFGGKDEFHRFLTTSRHTAEIDSIMLLDPIPAHLTKAIIPLGLYEQEKMNVK